MALLRIRVRDGREFEVRSYTRSDERVELLLGDGSAVEVPGADIDLEGSFAANAGVDFEALAEPPPPGHPVLELVSRNERSTGDYLVIEGVVRNRSRAPLPSVVAKVIGQDDAGEFVTSEEALIDFSPLRPRMESPFRVVLKAGGRVRKSRLGFRALLGEPLVTSGADD